jgi:ferredoxin
MSLSKLFLNSSLRYSLNTFNCLNEIKLPIRNVFTKQQNISNLNRIQLANFSNSNILKNQESSPGKNENGINITFVCDGKKKTVKARKGATILDVTRENDILLEGACEGSCACSTCHVIIDPKFYSKLEEPSEDEEDLLELAFGLTDTSRLGCQVRVNEKMNGMTVTIPSATRNMAVDG